MNRLPPNCEDSERGVLGCILLHADCLDETVNLFPAGAQTFYVHAHGVIYTALLELHEKRLPLDLIAVQSKLKSMGKLEEVGGIGYISQLSDAVPSAANLAYYAEKVLEMWQLRQVIKHCTDGVTMAYDSQEQARVILDAVSSGLSSLTHSSATTQENTKSLVEKVLLDFEHRFNNKGKITGLETGFTDFDRLGNGLQPGNVMLVAARPGCGKTTLAQNIIENIAIDQKKPVGVIELEMMGKELVRNMVCSQSRLDHMSIGNGMVESDFPKLMNGAARVSKAPIFIDDECGINILKVKAKARRMHREHGIVLLVIDYFQLIHPVRDTGSPAYDLAGISAGIKELAKELKIPVILLSQMNREIETAKNRKPQMSDLKATGSLEQDADILGFLYEAAKDEHWREGDAVPVNFLICKYRGGRTKEIYLSFFKQFTRFEQTSRLEE